MILGLLDLITAIFTPRLLLRQAAAAVTGPTNTHRPIESSWSRVDVKI